MLRKFFGILTALITLIGAGYATYAALSFKPVQTYTANLDLCEIDPKAWSELFLFLAKNGGDVVILDPLRVQLYSDASDCKQGLQHRRENNAFLPGSGDEVSYYFLRHFADHVEEKLASELREQYLFVDGITELVVSLGQKHVNARTEIILMNEGLEDTFIGPFQVQITMNDANQAITLTPPIITDQLLQKIKCAEKDWAYFQRVILCPLL